jgi:hypothetical protein
VANAAKASANSRSAVWKQLSSAEQAAVCWYCAHVQHGGLRAQGGAIVPTTVLGLALGDERLLSEVAVELYAATARMRLWPASSAWRRRFSLGSRSRSLGD